MTKQRALVLDIIRADKSHYTADEIFAKAKSSLPGISRATVYNNLHALEDEKIIRRISGEGGPDRYDSSYIPHGHLLCGVCHRIKDFEIPDFAARLAEIAGGSIDSYELKVRYICEICRSAAVG